MKSSRIEVKRLLVAISMALCLAFGGVASFSLPAHASAPVLLSGSAWLNGQGVNVCGPSTDPYCGNEYKVGGVSFNWWQCVELAQRLYNKMGWHSGTFGVSYAYQIYDVAPSIGMQRQANGNITSISPGDMIIHASNEPYSQGAGHVTVVDRVVGSTVYIVEQNTYNDQPRAQYNFSSGTLSRSGSGTIRGIVHDPANNLVSTSGSGTGTDSDEDGVLDSSDILPWVPGTAQNRGAPVQPSRLSGDFNGDDYQDIAAFYDYGGGQTKLFLFEGQGDGSFVNPTVMWDSGSGGWDWKRSKPVVGDFNHDGVTDIAVFYDYGSDQTKLWVFNGSSGTPLANPMIRWDSGVGQWSWSKILPVVGDFNGDGMTDISVFYDYGSSQTRLFLFRGQSSGSFSGPTQAWYSGLGGWDWKRSRPVTGDFNGDGMTDISVFYDYGSDQTKLWVFNGLSNGTFANPTIRWDSGVGQWSWSKILPIAGDFNGDDHDDITALYNNSGSTTKLWLFKGVGDGSIASPTPAWYSGLGEWDWSRTLPVGGDFNGDGMTDVATFYDYGSDQTKLWVFNGLSTNVFVNPTVRWDSGVGQWRWSKTGTP